MKKRVLSFFVFSALCMGLMATEKTQVWDFGAEQLDTAEYQNMLSVDEINSWFPGVAPGTVGTAMSEWIANDSCNIRFSANGKNNHRLRSTNEALTRYDNKSLTDAAGNVYTGYVYSNSSSEKNVYLASTYTPNERIEFMVGSNGNAATYEFQSPDGSIQTGQFTNVAKLEKLTFYTGVEGEYKIYCINEKLVVARIYRYPERKIAVNGTITAPDNMPEGYQIAFTNLQNNVVTTVTPVDGAYSVELAAGFDYELSLVNAPTHVVVNKDFSLTYEATATTNDVEIASVEMANLTGNITGLPSEQLGKVEFEFTVPEGSVYIPEMNIDRQTGSYTLQVEKGVEYQVAALNVNDYTLDSQVLSAEEDATLNLNFTAKPTYAITINLTGATAEDLANATFVFTNLNEEGYVYTFIGTENIALRDGVYSVKVENTGAYNQLLTSNLKVEGEATAKTIDFTAEPITYWDFKSTENYDASNNLKNPCSGITYTTEPGGKFAYHGSNYGSQASNVSINIPVYGPSIINVKVGYTWDISFGEEQYAATTGDNGKQMLTLRYTGEAGYATILVNAGTTSYIESIQVIESMAYTPVVTVGADKTYQTINDALAAIRKMERPNNESVTLMIDPGNYEEMLVIDMDSIRFVNASATPSIALKNQGVDIDENAVRITSYYGHGYNYASMGADYKWDARTLQVNKENGYASVVNGGGSGSTYWNATVVVEGKDFYAENIIFENSYNQYISAKEADDLVFEAEGGKGVRPTDAGNTSVQNRSFRERAAALAFTRNSDRGFLNNCRVIGRQDSFYGAECRVACYKGALMGACDFLFGEMNLTCYQTDLVMNTDEDKNDVAYITAPKTGAGQRGMLFFECNVVSAEVGTETAAIHSSKPGLWGRPWEGATSEAIFAGCKVDTCEYNGEAGNFVGQSLIEARGWDAGLSSASERCGEYACNVSTEGRVEWAIDFTEPKTTDGLDFTLFNWTKGNDNWDPFAEFGIDTDALPTPQDNAFATLNPFLNDAGIQMYSFGNEVFFKGIEETTRVQIYTLDGHLVNARQIEADACVYLPNGAYVLRAQNATGETVCKVLVK